MGLDRSRGARTFGNSAIFRMSVNVGAALFVKSGSFLYSIIVVGLAARQLTNEQTSTLLLAFNVLLPLGLLQATLGNYVTRLISDAHARGVTLYENPDVAAAFWLLVAGALVLFGIAAVLLINWNYRFLIPTAGLILLGVACSVGDQIRFATERSWASNAYQIFGYAVCCIGYALTSVFTGGVSLTVSALVAYGAPGVASIISFSMLLKDSKLRSFLFRPAWRLSKALAGELAPLACISLASVLLLNVYLLGSVVPWFPRLSHDDVVLMRLLTLTVNTCVFVFGPVMPTLAKKVVNGQVTRALGLLVLLAGSFMSASAGIAYYLAARFVAFAWVHQIISSRFAITEWAIVLMLWVGGSTVSQYAILRVKLARIAVIHFSANVFIVGAAWLLSNYGYATTVPICLMIGLIIYSFGSVLLVVPDFLGSGLIGHSQKMTMAASAMAEKKTVGQRS